MCKNCFTYAATQKCHTIICFAICGPYIQPGTAISNMKINQNYLNSDVAHGPHSAICHS